MARQAEIYLRDQRSILVSDSDGARVQSAISVGQQAVEVREIAGNRNVLNVVNVVRIDFQG